MTQIPKGNMVYTYLDRKKKVALKQLFGAIYEVSPVTASATKYHAAITLGTGRQTITTSITQPDIPRQLLLTMAASTIAGDVTIGGTDCANQPLEETVTLTGLSTTATTLNAFKTITYINVPIKTNSNGDTIALGSNNVIGLPTKFGMDTIIAIETADLGRINDWTLTKHSTTVSKNLLQVNGFTFDGTALKIMWMV